MECRFCHSNAVQVFNHDFNGCGLVNTAQQVTLHSHCFCSACHSDWIPEEKEKEKELKDESES